MSERTRQRQGRDFTGPENYLKNAEMAVEGNYNMIDGIINNTRADDGAKESVLSQLDLFRKQIEAMEPVDGHEPPERER
jgi:hypothetical protein